MPYNFGDHCVSQCQNKDPWPAMTRKLGAHKQQQTRNFRIKERKVSTLPL